MARLAQGRYKVEAKNATVATVEVTENDDGIRTVQIRLADHIKGGDGLPLSDRITFEVEGVLGMDGGPLAPAGEPLVFVTLEGEG